LRDPITAPRELRPECPVELEQIVLRALSRAADDRHANAADMEQALAAVQRDHALQWSVPPPHQAEQRPSSRSQLRRVAWTDDTIARELPGAPSIRIPVRRTPTRLAILGLALLGLVAGLLVLRGASTEATRRSPRAIDTEHKVTLAHRAEPIAPPAAGSPAPLGRAQPIIRRDAPEEPSAVGQAGDRPPVRPVARTRDDASAARTTDPGRSARGVRSTSNASKELSVPTAARTEKRPAPADVAAADLVREASAAFVRGQTPRARALYREVIRRAPDNADAWRGLGMVSSRMGERNEAAIAFRRYLQLRPNAPDAAAIRQKLSGL
jgi:hypothetical protein